MKALQLLFVALFCLAIFANAQKATVHINVANTTAAGIYVYIPDYSLKYNYLKNHNPKLLFDKSNSTLLDISLEKPASVTLLINSDDSNQRKFFAYNLFLSPGDDITFKADFKSKDYGIVVTGKGSANNEPLLANLNEGSLQQFYGDTLPNRVIAAVNKQYIARKDTLNKYFSLYKPTADFIKVAKINLDYFSAIQYFNFKENNKFSVQDAYYRNFNKWQTIQDSLFSTIKLSNDAALVSKDYQGFLYYFLLRKKEELWHKSTTDSVNFYKEWYGTNVSEGKKLFEDDNQNILREKIINKYFTGKTAEYLYAILFDSAIEESNPKNLATIFARFKQNYPNSKYIAPFNAAIDTIIEKQKQVLNNEMIFVADNGTKLNTLSDLLALTKGKTVLLDMWGTWCGPCRMEIEKNSAAIKEHFAGKGLSYYYVANYDMSHEKQWKDLIAYFDLKGTHILANDSLSNDIMTKVKGEGYPTYVIIKKDGTWELSKAGYPMNRDVLIKQLEEALAQ